MRAAIFRHIPFEGAGILEDVLRSRQIPFDYFDLTQGSDFPGLGRYDRLVFLGGPMSVNDDLPWLRTEEALIRDAIAGGIPLLGICLGAQLIAKALGARVYSSGAKEIGWYPIRFTPEAATDPLMAGLAEETVFHWHGETFDLPQGAILLASSNLCPRQAFRIGKSTYGLQFHLEVTPHMIEDWLQQDANCGDVREITRAVDPHTNSVRLRTLSERVFGAWCDL